MHHSGRLIQCTGTAVHESSNMSNSAHACVVFSACVLCLDAGTDLVYMLSPHNLNVTLQVG